MIFLLRNFLKESVSKVLPISWGTASSSSPTNGNRYLWPPGRSKSNLKFNHSSLVEPTGFFFNIFDFSLFPFCFLLPSLFRCYCTRPQIPGPLNCSFSPPSSTGISRLVTAEPRTSLQAPPLAALLATEATASLDRNSSWSFRPPT